ncbi:transcription/translation regulatory transformer protein RfaH [Shewanella surugensis]|uniref:Transcription antitermination protein RfaH n=1 Tax=Shewanella surugensis TaxID=212020 RepID=A0ABT0L847_9GAMM|nr:transcription/translation regulatory transformer protein RfaH [Shewanella surugensis]MCL1123871.1 transcription/translation regulatory transformer protein RfaH [Shewanella surugensis]
MKAWYLLYCKSRGEVRAQQNLAMQNIETYLPTLSKKVTLKGESTIKRTHLFPSYVFIYFDPLETSVSRIHSTRGVVRIVGCKEVMTPIHESIIKAIRQREANLLAAINNKKIATETLEDKFTAGDKVRFTQGPFVDLEGIFSEKSGDKRCHILFELMGQQQLIIVNSESLEPVLS